MELQQLKYFKAVADAGKISDAAKALFISPPALSATISRLERELGVKLFDRSNNRIAINQHGQLHAGRPSHADERVDGGAHRAPRV